MYFGFMYYDARISRWISTDPALQEGKYFPNPNDFDTEHDFYWYLNQDGSRKLSGMGGVFNAVNMDVYHYAGLNPVKLVDPDGEDTLIFVLKEVNVTLLLGGRWQTGFIIDENMDIWAFSGINFTIGANLGIGPNAMYSTAKTGDVYLNSQYITIEGGLSIFSGEVGCANKSNGGVDWAVGGGVGKSFLDKLIKGVKVGGNFNFVAEATSSIKSKKLTDPKFILKVLTDMKKAGIEHEIIDKAIKHYKKKVGEK